MTIMDVAVYEANDVPKVIPNCEIRMYLSVPQKMPTAVVTPQDLEDQPLEGKVTSHCKDGLASEFPFEQSCSI